MLGFIRPWVAGILYALEGHWGDSRVNSAIYYCPLMGKEVRGAMGSKCVKMADDPYKDNSRPI